MRIQSEQHFLIAAAFRFPLPVLPLSIAFVAMIQSAGLRAEEMDLETIRAKVDWYISSIQSCELKYRTVLEWDRKGWKATNARTSTNAVPKMPERQVIDYEMVRLGANTWLKEAQEGSSAYILSIFDGRNTYKLRFPSPNAKPEVAQFAQGDTIAVPLGTPLSVAGFNVGLIGPQPAMTLNEVLKMPDCKFVGRASIDNSIVYEVKLAPAEATPELTIERSYFLDPKHDLLPRRIEWNVMPPGKLSDRFTVKEFRKCQDFTTGQSRWFPAECLFEWFVEPGGVVAFTLTSTVLDVAINQSISVDKFRVDLPDGITVIDNQTHRARILGSDQTREEAARKLVEASKASLAQAVNEAQHRSQTTTKSVVDLTLFVTIGLGVVSLSVLVWAVVQTKRSAS